MQWTQVLQAGIQWHRAGQLDKAVDSYRKVLAANPQQTDALNLLGLAYHQAGQSRAGAGYIAQAIQLNGKEPAYYNNLGLVLRALGETAIALEAYQQAIRLDPKQADAWYNQGNLQRDLGRWAEAAASYEQSLRLQSRAADVLNNLGVAYKELKRWAEAEGCFRRALAIAGQYAEAHSNLGTLLEQLGRYAEAVPHGEQAVRLEPQAPDKWVNLAVIWDGMKQIEKARECYQRALQLDPQNAIAHLNLGMLLLRSGDYAAGWREYEWRLQCKAPAPRRAPPKPRWDGSPLQGRSILIQAEQGLGDTLQFIRFLPLVVAQGGRVILECQAPLVRLLGRMAGIDCIHPWDAALPDFDCYAPLMSLPLIFGTTLETLPCPAPYITWPEARQQPPSATTGTGRKKVGLCWSSNVRSQNNLSRLIKLETLRPLLELRHCEFFSFQMGPPAAEIQALPPELWPADLTPQIRDFADTAERAAQMDLIITVDTAMAHLAGAMNLPVWTLLSYSSDWRWLLERTDSPWYPSMRLFRQSRPGGWEAVVLQVREHLQALNLPG